MLVVACRRWWFVVAAAFAANACTDEERPGSSSLDEDGAPASMRDRDAHAPSVDDDDDDDDDAVGDAGREDEADDASMEPEPLDAGGRCGDGSIDAEREECDGENLGDLSCLALGFASGELSCSELCDLDLSACVGAEDCHDGRDNDGDARVDCNDDDCAEACAVSCDGPVMLDAEMLSRPSGVALDSTNLGHADELDPTCSSTTGGSEVVYRVVPSSSGVLRVEVETPSLLVVSVRRSCDAAITESDAGVLDGNELACAPSGRVVDVPTTAGEPLLISVDGRRPSDTGAYTLHASLREIRCGDGFRDDGEGCDDGNLEDDDGCSSNCELSADETEPNDDVESASDYANPFYARIDPAGDVDAIAIDVSNDTERLLVRTISVGDDACALRRLDSVLTLVDGDGNVLAEDDDGGEGTCSSIELFGLAGGTYYALVAGAEGASPSTFPYRLAVVQMP